MGVLKCLVCKRPICKQEFFNYCLQLPIGMVSHYGGLLDNSVKFNQIMSDLVFERQNNDTVMPNEYDTPRLRVFCLVHLRHLPKEKITQMVYHFKALI